VLSLQDDGGEYLRTIEINGAGLSLVHWWFYPDSYDMWMPSAQIEVESFPMRSTIMCMRVFAGRE